MKFLLTTKKLFYYFKRTKELGFAGTVKRISNRAQRKIYKFLWKQKALSDKANHAWPQISKTHKLNKNFSIFFAKLKNKNFIQKVLDSNEFKRFFINDNQKVKKFSFKNKLIFYQDIKIDYPQNPGFDKRYPDIKNPWEQSRFQHFFTLGKKYQKTKISNYAKTFCKQVNDWINKNPFLLGVNWMCPMEVAIRAINFIYGFYFFKNSKKINLNFWKKLVCSL